MSDLMASYVPQPDQLATCPVCGHVVARQANTCPNCGTQIHPSMIDLAVLVLLVLVLVAFILALRFGTPQNLGMGWFQLMADVAWPTVVLLGVGLLTLTRAGRGLANAVASRLQKVSALGVEVDLTSDTAADVKATFQETLDNYREQIKRQFDHQVRIFNIDGLLRRMIEKEIWPSLRKEVQNDCRCTIHVEDVLLTDSFYQLLDYYPQGGGRGRPFSMRYGIVGKVWRLGREEDSLVEGAIPIGSEEVEKLMREWGMTRSEAIVAGQGRQSFAAILIFNAANSPVGIFYCDSKVRNAFGDDFKARVLMAMASSGLPVALDALGVKMRSLGPNIANLA